MTQTLKNGNIELRPAIGFEWKAILVASWLNNKEHMRYSEQRHKEHSEESVQDYRMEHLCALDKFLWDIHLVGAEDNFIGTISAYIDKHNKRAEMGILISPMFAHGGYGTDAWKLAMEYLKTRVDAISAGMMASNDAMQKICHRSGMTITGFLEDRFLLDGKRESCIFFGWKRI